MLFYHFEICKLIINIDNPPADCVSTPLCTRGALGFGGALPQTPLRGSPPLHKGGFRFRWDTSADSATRIHPSLHKGVFFMDANCILPAQGGWCDAVPRMEAFYLYTNKTPRRPAGSFPIIYILATPLSRAAFATAAATAALTVLSNAEGMI